MIAAARFALMLALVACTGTGSPPPRADRDAVIRSCTDALANMPRAGGGFSSIAAACGAIYREPGCVAAFRGLAESASPGDGIRQLTDGCARAYCPRLVPRDPICDQDLTKLDPEHIRLAWAHLNERIVALELGLSPDDGLVKAYGSVFVTTATRRIGPVAPAHPSAQFDPASSLIVHVEMDPAGVVSYRVDGAAPVQLGTSAELAPIVQAAVRGGLDTPVVIQARANVPHGAVVTLMQKLNDAGIHHLAIATDASDRLP